MAIIGINLNPTPRELKWFGAIVLVFFALIGANAPWSRYNPFDRTTEDRARDELEGRGRIAQILAEMARVRALGPEFTEAFLRRDF